MARDDASSGDDRQSAKQAGAAGAAAWTSLEQLVRWRRDVRRFRTDPVPDATVDKLIAVADLAPSVGNSQPWRIIKVQCPVARRAMAENFKAANTAAAGLYNGDQHEQYVTLKLAGFDAAPVQLAVFCDRATGQGHGLGRQTMPETLDQSCTCMITVLWLAAREAGLGLGWVSILDADKVTHTLGVSPDWKLVGYLLLGWPEEEHLDPELERHGWQNRTPPGSRVFSNDQISARHETVDAPPLGRVTLVGAGPGDPELLTLKALRALASADVVLTDDLVAEPVLAYVRKGAEILNVGKRGYRTSCKQPDINAMMVELARQGRRVVRLKSGDPLIFGRAGEEIAACRAAGIAVEIVPGITSAQGAAARLGVSLTHRDHARRLQYITAHDRHGKLPPDIDWAAVADPAATTVVYMPKHTLAELTAVAMAHGLDPATPALAVANATRPDEQVLVSTLGAIADAVHPETFAGPVLVLIGEALRDVVAENLTAVAVPAHAGD